MEGCESESEWGGRGWGGVGLSIESENDEKLSTNWKNHKKVAQQSHVLKKKEDPHFQNVYAFVCSFSKRRNFSLNCKIS